MEDSGSDSQVSDDAGQYEPMPPDPRVMPPPREPYVEGARGLLPGGIQDDMTLAYRRANRMINEDPIRMARLLRGYGPLFEPVYYKFQDSLAAATISLVARRMFRQIALPLTREVAQRLSRLGHGGEVNPDLVNTCPDDDYCPTYGQRHLMSCGWRLTMSEAARLLMDQRFRNTVRLYENAGFIEPNEHATIVGRGNAQHDESVHPVARWTLGYVRQRIDDPFFIRDIVHLKYDCSGLSTPTPVLLHETVVQKVRWCKKCKESSLKVYGPIGTINMYSQNNRRNLQTPQFPDLEEGLPHMYPDPRRPDYVPTESPRTPNA